MVLLIKILQKFIIYLLNNVNVQITTMMIIHKILSVKNVLIIVYNVIIL